MVPMPVSGIYHMATILLLYCSLLSMTQRRKLCQITGRSVGLTWKMAVWTIINEQSSVDRGSYRHTCSFTHADPVDKGWANGQTQTALFPL